MRGTGWFVAVILAVVLAFVLVKDHQNPSPGAQQLSAFPKCSAALIYGADETKTLEKAKTKHGAAMRPVSQKLIDQTEPAPGAYGVRCKDGWAVADISHLAVGTTDGYRLFHVQPAWVETRQLEGDANCVMRKYDHVPARVANYLANPRYGAKRC
jgi:hypothetical protein